MGCDGSSQAAENIKKILPRIDKVNVLFILGGPASGKGTLCEKIKGLGFIHKSSGDILRDVVRKEEHPNWKELKEKMSKGEFVSSEELMGFIKEEFKPLVGKKVLLDGFPRNQENVDVWNKSMKAEVNELGMIFLDCSAETMQQRSKGRGQGRDDDNEETMKKRIANFVNDTVPVVQKYEAEGGTVIRINAEQTKEEVFKEFQKKFAEKGFA